MLLDISSTSNYWGKRDLNASYILLFLRLSGPHEILQSLLFFKKKKKKTFKKTSFGQR